jgi:integrase
VVGVHASAPDQGLLAWAEAQSFGNLGRRDDGGQARRVRSWAYLNPAEIAHLADKIHPAYRALVFVGAYGGLRIGELAALRRSRVDFAAGTVDVAETVNELKASWSSGRPRPGRAGARSACRPGSWRSWPTTWAPGRLTDQCSRPRAAGQLRISKFRRNIWRPAVADANLMGLRIHDLRHTAVALWIAAGASPKEVAARAGRTSVSFVLDRYGHLFPEADTVPRARLDSLFRAATEHRRNTVA